MTERELENLLPDFIRHSETYSLVITDLEGRCIYVNEVFKKRFSFLAIDFVGQPFSVTTHPEDVEKCRVIACDCLANPDKIVKMALRKPDHLQEDFHWAHWEFSLFKDLHDQPVGILGLGHDMAETARANTQSKDSDPTASSFIEVITDGVFVLDRHWVFLKINKAAEQIVGIPREELLGQMIWDVLPDTPEYNYPAAYRKAMNEHVAVAFEDHAGFDRWYSVVCYPSQEGLTVFFRDITEVKKAEEALKLSEIKLRAVLDSIADANILISADYQILSFNKQAYNFRQAGVGKQLREMADMRDYVMPNDLENFLRDSQRALKGESFKFEKEFFFEKFSIWCEISCYPVYDSDGKTLGFTLNTTNIDERKRKEIELQESNERIEFSEVKLRAILDSTTDANILIGPDYKILSFNKQAYKYSQEHLEKPLIELADFRDYVLPSNLENFIRDSQRTLDGESLKFEEEFVFEKVSIWLEISFFPVYDSDGKTLGFTLNTTDISERKRKQIELIESKNRIEKTLESIPHPLVIVNEQMNITYVNDEFEKVFGYVAQEVLHQQIDFLIPERYRHTLIRLLNRYLKTGGKLLRKFSESVSAVTKDNREISLATSLNTFLVEGEKFVLVILEDLTEFKRRHNTILKQNEVLRQIAWQQSHELRHPVASILGIIYALQNYTVLEPEERDQYLIYLFQAAKKLDEIVEKIVAQANENSDFSGE